MALTPQQQRFLDSYVRKHAIKGRGKSKRAGGFSALRDQVTEALGSAPPLLPQYPQLLVAMKAADSLGDQLKFARATAAMQQVLADIQAAVKAYRPPADPAAQQVADLAALASLRQRHRAVATDRAWQAQQGRSAIGGDLKIQQNRAGALLDRPQVNAAQLAQAADLVDEMEVKRRFLLRRMQEIDKRRAQLRKYALDITSNPALYPDAGIEPLIQEAQRLADIDTRQWTPVDETAATSAYLDMMLVLAEDGDAHHRNFKANKDGSADVMVMALRRKDKPRPGATDGALAPNFKLIVKPIDREIAVDGFKKGGGAPREVMGGVIGDKLQEMLGLDLNVARTKLVQVDGGGLKTGNEPGGDNGYASGQKITASAQAFVRNGASIEQLAQALLADTGNDNPGPAEKNATAGRILDQQVDKEAIHQMAVFDLIALHADRHCGNFMLDEDRKLVPIDHGNVMPTPAGLRGRAANLGPAMTVLGNTAAVHEMVAPQLAQRLERLNIDELVATLRAAQQDMVAAHPDVDGADLQAGLANVRRSAEFMKFAARQLTLHQIYHAYETCQDFIFFSDETVKLDGFAQAVEAVRGRDAALQRLAVLTGEDMQTHEGLIAVAERLQTLGWLASGRAVNYTDFVKAQPRRCLQILEGHLTSPLRPMDDATLLKALGGQAALVRLGYGAHEGGTSDKAKLLCKVLATTGRMP